MSTGTAKQRAPRFTWSTDNIWTLIGTVEKEENRKVLLGLRVAEGEGRENTSGDSKTAVYKRIGAELFPAELELVTDAKAKKAVGTTLGLRVKAKWEGLMSTYKEHASTMIATGGGLKNLRDEQLLEALHKVSGTSPLYVPPEGPTEETTDEGRNLWEDINKKFIFFGRLHSLVATRPNMNPISITTGAGPLGSTTLHPQPPSPDAYVTGTGSSKGWDGLSNSDFAYSFPGADPFSVTGSDFLNQLGGSFPPPSGLPALSNTSTQVTQSAISSSLSTPASLPTSQLAPAAPASSQASAKGKVFKPQPPKVSSLSEAVIKKAAKRKSEKKGLEEVLISIHKSNASAVAKRLKAETQLKRNDQILAQFNAGLLTKGECRQMLGLGGGESSGKKRKADKIDAGEQPRSKKPRSASPSEWESASDESDENGNGSNDSGEDEEEEDGVLYGSP
ncbi:hypothetical protein FRC05_009568 [Tulasnella sp. 425]|nr:hypothetical protein FRC05_009568 [Tulasnella sp. 425]